MAMSRTAQRLAPIVLLVAVLVVWEAICRGLQVSEFIFPAPTAIFASLVEFSGVIAQHACRAFWTTMAGFAISSVVGVLLAFLIGSSRIAYAAVHPLSTGLHAPLKAALVPVLEGL